MNKRIRDDTQAARKKLKTEDGEEPVGDELDALVAAVDGLKHLGRAIAPPFRKLPPKQQYPDYYQLIKKPIAIESIRQNLKQGEYLTLDMLKQDLLQMTNNAKRYNEKGSGLYLDAKLISSLVKTWGGGQAAPSSSDDEAAPLTMKQKIAWILQKLHQVFDGERRLAEIFSVLPDKEMYPDYYKIIKRPISLKEIDKDNKRGNYKNIDKFADDLEQMYTNALTFNEDQSIVAQDARALKELSDKLIADVRADTLAAPAQPVKIKFKTQPEALPRVRMSAPQEAKPAPVIQESTPVTAPMQRQPSLQKQQTPQPRAVPLSKPATTEAAVVTYSNSGAPLIKSLHLSTPSMAPPMHLALAGIQGHASQLFTWTLPISGNVLSVAPCLSERDVQLRVLVNRAQISSTRRSDDGEVYEARLSTGANCIECIAEADGMEDPQEAEEESGRTRLRAQQHAQARRERERIVVLVYVR